MNEEKKAKPRKPSRRRIILLIVLVILMYIIIFPIPYIIHTNLDNAGIVIQSTEIPLKSLPRDIQELCNLRGIYKPHRLIVKHVEPERITLVISSKSYQVGTVVEMFDFIANWIVDWRDFNFANQPFDKLVISDLKQLGYHESLIERMLFNTQGTIGLFTLSKVTYYGGPVLFILCLTILVQRRLALWNIPALISSYSFQVWVQNLLAFGHKLHVATELTYFGYVFVALFPASIYAWHFERSPGGRYVAKRMKSLSRSLGLILD